MNIRKPTDYTTLFTALDAAVAAQLPQMELYCEIGRVVSGRGEKGAAVAASEYLQAAYPAADGFSPRNVRRMRDFYRMYGDTPELLAAAMRLNWTQNVVIMEAELTMDERCWYIRKAAESGLSKTELLRMIERAEHSEIALGESVDTCYTVENDEFFQKSCTFLICPTGEGVSRARRGRERQRRWRCTDKGAILSRERMAPLDPQENARGSAP